MKQLQSVGKIEEFLNVKAAGTFSYRSVYRVKWALVMYAGIFERHI
jgi:hypothetical protein